MIWEKKDLLDNNLEGMSVSQQSNLKFVFIITSFYNS